MNLFQLRKKIEMQTGRTISSARIGADLGLKRQQYWNYEQGKHQPDIFVVRAMTQYFRQWMPDLTIEEMIDIIEETVKSAKKELAAA